MCLWVKYGKGDCKKTAKSLGFPGEYNVIGLEVGGRIQNDAVKAQLTCARWRKGLQTKECGWPLGAGKGKEVAPAYREECSLGNSSIFVLVTLADL